MCGTTAAGSRSTVPGHSPRPPSGVAEGAGGRQILVEDPSGNPVELFEPSAR